MLCRRDEYSRRIPAVKAANDASVLVLERRETGNRLTAAWLAVLLDTKIIC
jgi:hypothetical protein